MAVDQAAVTGKVLDPMGNAVPYAKIEVQLSAAGSVDDAGSSHVTGGKFTVRSDASGDVSFNIVPNDSITPAGTVYTAKYQTPAGSRWQKTWTITGTSAKDIGDL